MSQYENTVVTVEGHTDNSGSDALNQQLSQARANAVKEALVSNFGIAAERVTALGYGETRPIADNATLSGRAENRRVVGSISVSYSETLKK